MKVVCQEKPDINDDLDGIIPRLPYSTIYLIGIVPKPNVNDHLDGIIPRLPYSTVYLIGIVPKPNIRYSPPVA